MSAIKYHPDTIASTQGAPGKQGEVVTPSDTVDLTFVSKYIYVGVTGDVRLVMDGGQTLTFKAVPAGTFMPVRASRVMATGTAATNLVSLY